MKKKVYSILATFLVIATAYGQTIRVATYNIRQDAKKDIEQGDGWQQRKTPLAQLIRFHDFDIFGAQEVLNNQLNDLLKLLPVYTYVGVGRDDGATKGEYAPIFFKKDRFKLLDNGHFWLSEEIHKPNRGWDAALPRICTWALFKDLKNKKTFLFFNTHFDHRGTQARLESAKLILKKIEELSKNRIPVVLTGDFNVDQTSESYQILTSTDQLKDSYGMVHEPYQLNGTFNNFRIDVATTSRIDCIFVSTHFEVKKYGVLTDTYHADYSTSEGYNPNTAPGEIQLAPSKARTPSDHFPVTVELSLN